MDLILKSRGNWIDGHRMLSRQELAELGLDRPDVVPFHIDPRTKAPYDKDHIVEHPYDALVRTLARGILKTPNLTNNVGEAQMKARRDINKATRRFNHRKRKKGDDHNTLPMPYPEDGTPGLHHDYKQNFVSERFEKHPTRDKDNRLVTEVPHGKGSQRVHPADRVVRNVHGNLITTSLSEKDDDGIEHIEGAHLHPYTDLEDVVHESGYHFPYKETRGGIINADAGFVERADGMGRGLRRFHRNQDPTSPLHGGGTPKDKKAHRGLDGEGYNMLRAIASLHPSFFEPKRSWGSTVSSRFESLQQIFGEKVPPTVLQRLAATPAGDLLTAEFRGFADRPAGDSKPGRSMGMLRKTVNELRAMIGAPVGEAGHMETGGDAHRRKSEFEWNADNILLVMGLDHGSRNDWAETRKVLSEALYASIIARKGGGVRPNSLQNELFSYMPEVTPIDPREIKSVPYNENMGPQIRLPTGAESPEREPMAGARGGLTPGGQVSVMGTEPAPQPPMVEPSASQIMRRSMDPVFTIMESLQRADARMDDAVLKSLPSNRPFSVSDRGDREDLCKTYDISSADLYYIKEGRGDWERLAQDLNVEPLVVKGVKVALGD